MRHKCVTNASQMRHRCLLKHYRYPDNVLLVRTEAVDGELGDLPEAEVPDGAAPVSQLLHRGLPQQLGPPGGERRQDDRSHAAAGPSGAGGGLLQGRSRDAGAEAGNGS